MTNRRKILIIEDEQYAAERLKLLLNEIAPEFIIYDILPSISESVKFLKSNKVDLIFMDINLSDGYSFEIFEKVEVNSPIIFTTAYDEFALKAFKVNSIDYLLKPLKKTELQNAINKLDLIEDSILFDRYKGLSESLSKAEQIKFKERFLISFGNKLKAIKIEDIAYFYAKDKSVFLMTFDAREFPVDETLDSIEKQISNVAYFRINRKFIVHIDSIQEIIVLENYKVQLKLKPEYQEEDVIVSGAKTRIFKNWLEK